MTPYLPRDIHRSVVRAMGSMPVVVITGPRQSGKSTFLKKDPLFKEAKYYDLDDFETLDAMRQNPQPLLEQKQCVIIDEVQRAPDLFIAVKRAVDRDRRPGRFILSGSANLSLLGKVSESLAGRAIYLDMPPMTRREIHKHTSRTPFIVRLLNEQKISTDESFESLSGNEILRGGMPSVCLGQVQDPAVWFAGYLQTYLEKDVRDLSRITDLILFRNFLQLTALRTGQLLNQSEIGRDAKMNAVKAGRYLSLLEASFLISRLQPHLNNKSSRVIKSAKLFLADSGIAAYLAGIRSVESLKNDSMQGALVETFVAQNLKGILSAHFFDVDLRYWHVQGRYEVDFVLCRGNKTVAIEVKSATRWKKEDLISLRAYLGSDPKCFTAILAYNGTKVTQLDERLWAIPLSLLLS